MTDKYQSKNLLQALTNESQSVEQQQDSLISMGELVFRESLVRLIAAMDTPTQEAFDELLSKNPSEDELMTFLSEKVPNAEAIVQGGIDEIGDDILAASASN